MPTRSAGSLLCLSLIALFSCSPQEPSLGAGEGDKGALDQGQGAVFRAAPPDLGRYALKVVCLWIDHGDATLLFLPNGEIALVDTGQEFAVKGLLMPFLRAHGIWKLDHLFITHYHGDHSSGMIKQDNGLFVGDPGDPNGTRIPVRHFWDYNNFHAGQRVSLGGANLLVLNSAHENVELGENEKSLSFKLEVQGFGFTLGADIYSQQQERILRENAGDVRSHVYRTNHHLHGSVSREYLIQTDPYLFITSAEYAVYQREAYTVDFQKAVDYLRSHGGRLLQSLLTLEDGNAVIWANSDRDWGYGNFRPGDVIPTLGSGTATGGISDTSDAAAHRPRCSPGGLESPGIFKLDLVSAEPGWGWMNLSWGRGFSCKSEPAIGSEDSYPTCLAACPDKSQSPQNGWGWCEGTQGFSCRMQ